MKPEFVKVLSDNDIQQVHTSSMQILEQTGIYIQHPELLQKLKAAGVKVDENRVKALIAALEGVNIEEAVKKAATAPVAAAPSADKPAEGGEAKPEKSAEEEKKEEAQAAAGLGSLFG